MMKLNINIELSGEMADVMKDFNALGSILSAANCTASATALPADVNAADAKTQSPDLGSIGQPPKTGATEMKSSMPKNDDPAHQKAAITPTPEPVKAAEAESVNTTAPEPSPSPVPTAPAKKYTLDELLAATAPLMDAGKISELQALMQKFGVPSMMEIPEERYGELATALRELGAAL